jgi:Kef-type K+ transport system membrane component KefB/CBS domain-containing protein
VDLMSFGPLLQALAVILFAALIGGRLAAACHIPRVTGYLLSGLLVGPSGARLLGIAPLLDADAVAALQPVTDLALALILLNIGAQFRADNLRRWQGRILRFSLAETGVTFLVVALATAAANQFVLGHALSGWGVLHTSLAIGLVLGSIAMTTAPAATLMVIREYEAEGPVTATIMTLIGLNGLAATILFTLVGHLLFHGQNLATILLQVSAPLVIGGGIGLLVAGWSQSLELSSEHKLVLVAGALATASACRVLQFNPLLACFAFGTVLANSSPRWHKLYVSLREIDYPVYVPFFVLAGARLHLETLAHLGSLGLVYVAARGYGKWQGARLGARWGAFGERERKCIPTTLFAQGAVAIGLAGALNSAWPEGGRIVESVILGAVLIFELIGPLAVRFGLVQSGEVPLLTILAKRAPENALEGLHSVVQHFRHSLGLPAGMKVDDPGDILVQHIMRRNVETVRAALHYNDLLHVIAHSRYDRFPVVDDQNRFLGMIDYTEIRNLLFEPDLVPLVVAGDLASAATPTLHPDQSLRAALEVVQQHRNVSFFAVTASDNPRKLVGIVSQNDILAAFRRATGQAVG